MNNIFHEICLMLNSIEDYHDSGTRKHEIRTGKTMKMLGEIYGFDKKNCKILQEIGSIHDIGKIALPANIIEKPGPLTQFERKVVELHPIVGYDIIKKIDHPFSEMAGNAILTHHENYDGSGYPKGLSGKKIPIEGRICAICDCYDALREHRRYRKSQTHEQTVNLMFDDSPTGLYHKFDPVLIALFLDIAPSIQQLYDDK